MEGASRTIRAGGLVTCPYWWEPAAHDDRHANLFQSLGHLRTMFHMGGFCTLCVPYSPRHLHTTESHTHVSQTIVDHRWILRRILDAEVTAESSKHPSRFREVEGYRRRLMMACAVNGHRGGKLCRTAFLEGRQKGDVKNLIALFLPHSRSDRTVEGQCQFAFRSRNGDFLFLNIYLGLGIMA